VKPGEEGARDAGLRPGSPLYRAAMWWLQDKGALVPDWEANAWVKNRARTQHRDVAFRLARHGVGTVREA
jgi:hypothetical protein